MSKIKNTFLSIGVGVYISSFLQKKDEIVQKFSPFKIPKDFLLVNNNDIDTNIDNKFDIEFLENIVDSKSSSDNYSLVGYIFFGISALAVGMTIYNYFGKSSYNFPIENTDDDIDKIFPLPDSQKNLSGDVPISSDY